MAMKKDFSASLKRGVERDKVLRSDNSSKFNSVDAALAGRANLLEESNPRILPGPSNADALVANLEQTGKVTSRFVQMQIDKIDDNPLNSRTVYKEEMIAARATSMVHHGQLQPALSAIDPKSPDRAILIDGHYQKQGALRNRVSTLELKLLEGLNSIDFYRLARTANNERAQETILDVAYGYRKLLDLGHAKTNDELASLVEEPKSKVSKTLAILDLPQSVQDVMSSHPEQFGLVMGYELSLFLKATDEKQTLALAERIRDDELSHPKVKMLRESLMKQKAPRKSPSCQFKILSKDGATVGAIKQWGNGNIQIDLTL